MKTFKARIEGTSPLLQNRFGEEAELNDPTRPIIQKKGTPRQQADAKCYRNGNGFYIPGTWLFGTIREAGANHKIRGSRRSVKFVVPAGVQILEVDVPLMNGTKAIKDFEIDSRPVVIPSTKGRIMCHRPRFEQWAVEFHVTVDEEVIPADLTKQLLDEAGRRVGIGDYRPAKSGPFGRFTVTEWKEIA